MYSYVKPVTPPCEGPQFSNSALDGSVNKDNYLERTRDQYNNEITGDRVMHGNSTPEEGGFNWDGKQYSTDFSSYGSSVDSPSGVSSVTVDNSRADRGKDA